MNYEDLNKQQKESEIDTFTLERYRQFARHITRKNIKILDVGCNTGRGGKILKEMIPSSSIVGVDIVESRLQKVEPNVYDELMYLSIMEINSSYNDTFDYVVAGEVVEHIAPEDMSSFLGAIYRILRKNGEVILTTPNPNSLLVKLGRNGVFDEPSHLSIQGSKKLSKKLKASGFKDIKVYGSGKASRYISERFPLLALFGSYLIKGKK